MELFAADGHDAGGCERVTGKSGMRPQGTATGAVCGSDEQRDATRQPTAPVLGHVGLRPATATPRPGAGGHPARPRPMRHATAAAAQNRRPRPRHRAPHLGGAVRAGARRRSVHHGRSAFALNAKPDLTIGQAAAYVRDCRGARGPFGRGVLTRPILAPRARRRPRPNHRWRLSWPSRTPDAPPPARSREAVRNPG